MKNLLGLFFLSFALTSCDNDDNSNGEQSFPPVVVGMNYAKSTQTFEETYTTLRDALDSNPSISIIAEVDHSMNANGVGLSLNPTKIIFFGNPTLGTPLMNVNQQSGLDLPQRMLVYRNAIDEVFVGYNSTTFLGSRHSLDAESATLSQISDALSTIAGNVSQSTVVNAVNSNVSANQGINIATSEKDFDDTYEDLRDAIQNNANLTIITELDHQANAQSVNLTLMPTKVIIFGNPTLGSQLMINSQTTALDLPQKILVYENAAGEVIVAYNDPSFIANRHRITGNGDVVSLISGALQNLSNAAVRN
jgi:uncharacterized protein (DUF302 family)